MKALLKDGKTASDITNALSQIDAEVLEHAKNPRQVVDELARVTAPRAVL